MDDKQYSSNYYSRAVIIVFCIVLLVTLFVGVYEFRQNQIDKEVNDMQTAVEVTENEEIEEIDTVSIKIDKSVYSLEDFVKLNEIPATVDVVISYKDGSTVEKPAYVSYDDVENVEYLDNVYGRIIIPNYLHD